MVRSSVVALSLLLLLALLLAGCMSAANPDRAPATNATMGTNQTLGQAHGVTMTNGTADTIIFSDRSLYFELVRTLGKALEHGSDLGESLETARRIAAHEGEGLHPLLDAWYREWNATAERVHAIGVEAERRNHTASAGAAYLRASEYYRAADFFLHDEPANPEIVRLWDAMHGDFVRGLTLTGVRFEEVEIPYGNTTLHGYFFPAYADGRRAPTLVVHQGFDGTAEECWFGVGADGVRRGYNVLAFDGPGQGRAVRKQGLHFRPDWEAVVTPVVDWTLARSDVDPDRVVLYGISMGGYLAPRAAAYEPRLRAVIANEGVYDVFENDAATGRMTTDELRARPQPDGRVQRLRRRDDRARPPALLGDHARPVGVRRLDPGRADAGARGLHHERIGRPGPLPGPGPRRGEQPVLRLPGPAALRRPAARAQDHDHLQRERGGRAPLPGRRPGPREPADLRLARRGAREGRIGPLPFSPGRAPAV